MSAIDEVKQRLDIVEVVSEYLKLEKAGRNFRALCPFHVEKTPSLSVSPERQSWHCFGCGAGGDSFAFVMKKEKLDFGEALRLLARKAGITLARKPEAKDKAKVVERLREINEAGAKYYHHLLLTSPAAEEARGYLKRRGLTRETIDNFQLGFSLDSWDGVQKYLMERSYKESEIAAAGLLVEGEGRRYDRFRNRLMFPIPDKQGRVLGFGARALDDSIPKYLNSPQTILFDKSSALYGIDRARGAIAEHNLAIIVEGYMDVLTAHQHGMSNVVANMGTAITQKQLALLKGLTRNLALALDPDVAGIEATSRGIEVARQALDREALAVPTYFGGSSKLRAGIKIISLPEDKDPDQVIRESPQVWQQLVEEALPLIDYLFQVATSKLDISKAEGKQQAQEQLLPVIDEMEDEVERELYLRKLSRLLEVSERTLAGRAARLRRTRAEKPQGRREEVLRLAPNSGDLVEEYCLCLFLQHPELRGETTELLPDHFEHTENREIFIAWRNATNPESVGQSLDDNLHQHLSSLVTRVLPPAGQRQKELTDCIRRLQERRLRRLKSQEAEAESLGNVAQITALQQKGIEVNKELKRLFIKGKEE